MFEKVKEILARYTQNTDIQEHSVLAVDLGLSSFDVVSIVADFEEEFHIEISDRDMGKFVCVEDVLEYLERRV